MPRFNKSVFAGGWASGGPCPGAGALGGAYVSETPVGSILWANRVSSSVRLRFWPDGAGQKLAPRFEGPGIWSGLRREPAGNRGLGATGWEHPGVGMEEGSRGRAGLEDSAVAGV